MLLITRKIRMFEFEQRPRTSKTSEFHFVNVEKFLRIKLHMF